MNYHFNIEHAKKYGVNESIMINNFKYWILKNKANETMFMENRTWTYNSVQAYTSLFPFWSKGQISRTINSLVEQNVIIVGSFNKKKYDRTKWYAFRDEASFLNIEKCNSQNQEMDLPESRNAITKTEKPIPNSKLKDNNTYKDMVAVYNGFCLNRFDAPAKINGAEGNALKQIITYLKSVAKSKGYEESSCIQSFEYILNSWEMLDDFTQKQIKLVQINSNLTNIINQINSILNTFNH